MEDNTAQWQPAAPDELAGTSERRPWVRRTVTLAAAGALTAGAAAVAVPALANDTPSPTPTPSGGYSTDENAPEGPSSRGNCPDGERPGTEAGRPPTDDDVGSPDGMQLPDRGEVPEPPSMQEGTITSDA
jgi:hypothetical protein